MWIWWWWMVWPQMSSSGNSEEVNTPVFNGQIMMESQYFLLIFRYMNTFSPWSMFISNKITWLFHAYMYSFTSEHTGGMQPCSALNNLRSGAKREQSQAPQRKRERERSSSAHLYVRLQLHEKWAHFTVFLSHCSSWQEVVKQIPDRGTDTRNMTVSGKVITWACNVICCCCFFL